MIDITVPVFQFFETQTLVFGILVFRLLYGFGKKIDYKSKYVMRWISDRIEMN